MVEYEVSDAISMSNHLTIHVTLTILRLHRPDHVSVSHNIHAIRPEDIEYELELIGPLYIGHRMLMKWSLTLRPLLL